MAGERGGPRQDSGEGWGGHLHDPDAFIEVLREFRAAAPERRGPLADRMTDAIVTKHVDLAVVRHTLMAGEAQELLDTLEALMDLIEPYLEEGSAEE
jgi:hypothetical protein